MAIRVYYSYDSEDDKLRAKLQTHLAILKRQQEITEWCDQEIKAGDEWRRQSNDNLNNAQIILLLISADYLASDYCFGYEMARAIEMHRAREARVIPIILRPCDWQNAQIGKAPNVISLGELQALPDEAKPVTKWANRDEAFQDIARGIREVITELKPVNRESLYKPEIPEILPYLCDRSDQEDMLENALKQASCKQRRPFVAIIHGDEDECHERFRDRLQQFSLPRLLEIDTNQLSIRTSYLKWPSANKTPTEAQACLGRDLAERLTGRRSASMEMVAEEVSRSTAPVMIYSTLNSEDWQKESPKLFEAFLAFWNLFPDLSSSARLISCLSIKHDASKPEAARKKAEVVSYLEGLMTYRITAQLIENLRMEGLPEEVIDRLSDLSDRKVVGQQAFLTELRARLGPEAAKGCEGVILKAALNRELGPYERISGVILPEMTPVSEKEATDWVLDDRLFRDFCRKHSPSFCKIDEALMQISTLYNETMPRIPMQSLAKELKELLEKRC